MKIERPKPVQQMSENAKLVFKGKIFDVYQWEQEMYDGSKATFEKLKRPDTAVVFGVLDDGKILLTVQEQPGKSAYFAAAGGRIEEGEDPLEAAKREFQEETGYEAGEYVLWKAIHPVGKIDWVTYVFIAKGLNKASDISLDGGEKIKLNPVTFDEFLEISTRDNFSEKEIIPFLYKACMDPNEMTELKKLFDPKNV
jgi:8-oxo-dGTP pyrophosphatase MutT (NUDIX family)